MLFVTVVGAEDAVKSCEGGGGDGEELEGSGGLRGEGHDDLALLRLDCLVFAALLDPAIARRQVLISLKGTASFPHLHPYALVAPAFFIPQTACWSVGRSCLLCCGRNARQVETNANDGPLTADMCAILETSQEVISGNAMA